MNDTLTATSGLEGSGALPHGLVDCFTPAEFRTDQSACELDHGTGFTKGCSGMREDKALDSSQGDDRMSRNAMRRSMS